MRDNFNKKVKKIVAERVGYRCSRPGCNALTSGPQSEPSKSLNIGVAAHITSASPGGPRYDYFMSQEARRGYENAIWLCQTCAKLVDNDTVRFSADKLRSWKRQAESDALIMIEKAITLQDVKGGMEEKLSEEEIKRNLDLKYQMKRDFLKHPEILGSNRSHRPCSKFVYAEVIIRSANDSSYPNIDETPGISGWFKVELWDFYHNGLEVILNIVRGIIDANGQWARLGYDQKLDVSKYREINMWQIGRIPWRNIVIYDFNGDEIYPYPHLYCRFVGNGTPYEEIVYRIVDDTYDWHLNQKDQFEYVPKKIALRQSNKKDG